MYRTAIRRLGGIAMAAGALQFIVAVFLAESAYPGYSRLHNYVSDLGALASPTSPLFNSSVALLGACLIAAAGLLEGADAAGRALLALCGIGALGVAAFPEDYGAPMSALFPFLNGTHLAAVGWRHAAFALLTFFAGCLSCMFLSLAEEGIIRPLGLAASGLALTSLLAFVYIAMSRLESPLGVGGVERAVMYPILAAAFIYGTLKALGR